MCQITLVFKARTFDSTDFDSELQENGNLQRKIKNLEFIDKDFIIKD